MGGEKYKLLALEPDGKNVICTHFVGVSVILI
jgi:hypothetical protein